MTLEPMQEYTIPSKVIKNGKDKIVWDGQDGYIYKAYITDDFTRVSHKLSILNSLTEYENETIVGEYEGNPVTKQRKLKDWQEILATFFFTDGKRVEDWENEVRTFFSNNNFIKQEKYYHKDDKMLWDLNFRNIGMDENNNFKIIDCNVL